MPVEIKVPSVGESVTEVTIDKWLFQEGDAVERDKTIAVLESEKATVELPAEVSGRVAKILKRRGETAAVGEVIAIIDTDGAPSATPKAEQKPATPPKALEKPAAAQPKTELPKPPPLPARAEEPAKSKSVQTPPPERAPGFQPAREKSELPVTNRQHAEAPAKASTAEAKPGATEQPSASVPAPQPSVTGREEEVVPMTRLRRTVARRLVEAQHNAALLTTFNEIDMSEVMTLRKQYGEAFQQKYHVKLGFMSFFVKAVIDALKLVPQVNAEIRDNDIIFKNYYDIAVAIGGGKGLVVPVLRNAERLSVAEVEVAIGDFARRAKDNTLTLEELQGGTFTISNGGIYGSLLSTPIVNPPQSGILGMHSIQERPVAREGQVVIRPMMYVALTYDHRVVDGREAVTFLKRIKEVIEAPSRLLMEV